LSELAQILTLLRNTQAGEPLPACLEAYQGHMTPRQSELTDYFVTLAKIIAKVKRANVSMNTKPRMKNN
jgi:hypothetical protein